MPDNPTTQLMTPEEVWSETVRIVMNLAVKRCRSHAPGCPLNSCCPAEPLCLKEAWEEIAKNDDA